jgi:hypothetical protein
VDDVVPLTETASIVRQVVQPVETTTLSPNAPEETVMVRDADRGRHRKRLHYWNPLGYPRV